MRIQGVLAISKISALLIQFQQQWTAEIVQLLLDCSTIQFPADNIYPWIISDIQHDDDVVVGLELAPSLPRLHLITILKWNYPLHCVYTICKRVPRIPKNPTAKFYYGNNSREPVPNLNFRGKQFGPKGTSPVPSTNRIKRANLYRQTNEINSE